MMFKAMGLEKITKGVRAAREERRPRSKPRSTPILGGQKEMDHLVVDTEKKQT